MEQPLKRGRGRPRKLPDGKPHGVRCTLVNGELDRFNEARAIVDESQDVFTRKAVLSRVDSILADASKGVYLLGSS